MILTKDKLDSLAKEKAAEVLSNTEEAMADALINAKYQKHSYLDYTMSADYPYWALEKIGQAYEKEGYKVIYHSNMPCSFPPSYIRIIIDDEEYAEEEKKHEEMLTYWKVEPAKKWWKFWE